jgi:dihydroorotate dehydrogenase electron transfer subunit
MMSRKLKIVRKIPYTEGIFGLEFRCPGISPWPGQFFQVRVNEGVELFLNRPISIASYKRGTLLLIIKVVGCGTRMLSEKNPGEYLTLFGPFGRKFKPARKKSLIIAGGIGVAPLHFLGEYFCKNKIGFDLLYGVRAKHEFILRNELARMAGRATFVAESGYKKTETVVSRIHEMDLADYAIGYACGPREMLIALQKLGLSLPIYAFCEEFMGCGCGLCLGCAIMQRGTYRRVCIDGPVLRLGEIDFEV